MSRNDAGIVIGVDAGGSKTLAWVADLSEIRAHAAWVPLGRGQSGPGNPRAAGFDSATAAIEKSIRLAFQDAAVQPPGANDDRVTRLCIAAAGAGRETEQRRLRDWATRRFPTCEVRVTSDALPILAAASQRQVGIALICGTGSLAWGRNASGTTARCGGWGYLFGDEGSGYAIGAAGLRAVARFADGRGEPTQLLRRFCDSLEITAASQLIDRIYSQPNFRRRIAQLSEIVFSVAETDDVASRIIDDAADDLASLVDTLAIKLTFAEDRPTLAFGGGLLVHQPKYADSVRIRIKDSFDDTIRVRDPVAGAVLLAAAL